MSDTSKIKRKQALKEAEQFMNGTHPSLSTTGHDIDPNGVAHPSHYNVDPSGVECIDIVRHRNFNIGSAIKYLWRGGLKDEKGDLLAAHIKDLKKAIFYINDEIQRLEKLR